MGVSDSGYVNDEPMLDWIKHFDKFSAMKQQGEWPLLIVDRCGSHMTIEFIDYCWEQKIHPFNLPSHTSHILQPLDVGVQALPQEVRSRTKG